jgi:hypothetical protein
MMRHALHRALAAALLCAASAATGAAAADSRVGVTGPVAPHAASVMPGGATQELVPGQDVIAQEKIVTDAGGQAEILFLDRSSLRIGPNSEMTIDDFAYSPDGGSGRLAASASKGLLRFSGGDLSKRANQVTLRTPVAILGVRGGIALVEIGSDGATRATFLYGDALTIASLNGTTVTVGRPGYFSSIAANGSPPSPPQPASAADLAAKLALLNSGTPGGGANLDSAAIDALLSNLATIEGATAASNIAARASFIKALSGIGPLPACPGGKPRTHSGACY